MLFFGLKTRFGLFTLQRTVHISAMFPASPNLYMQVMWSRQLSKLRGEALITATTAVKHYSTPLYIPGISHFLAHLSDKNRHNGDFHPFSC